MIDAEKALEELLAHPPNETQAREILSSPVLTQNDLRDGCFAAAVALGLAALVSG